MSDAVVDFLYTEIGRGHPHYLDGIRACLAASDVGRTATVQGISRGPARLGWALARACYRGAASSSAVRRLYTVLREHADYGAARGPASAMARDVRRFAGERPHTLVVAHPVLAGFLRDRSDLVYQHGELAVPAEARVAGAFRVAVPDARAAACFVAAGIPAERVIETGLCIESQIVADAERMFGLRCARLTPGHVRHGLFISSGAEPPPHVGAIVSAAQSITAAGARATIMARAGGRLERAVRRARTEATPLMALRTWTTREELTRLSAAAVAYADYLVAPAHERSQWALGLGLPMFILGPDIGTYAPLNRERLLEAGVGVALGAPGSFAARLASLERDGTLRRMAESGWGRYPIDGFRVLADRLTSRAE